MKLGVLSLAVLAFALVSCNKITPAGGAKVSLSNDDEKTIYSVGVDMGTKLKTLQLSSKELAVLKMGIDDGSLGNEPQVEMKTYIMKVGNLLRGRAEKFAEKEKKEAEGFLSKAEKEKGAEKTQTGLIYVAKEEGKGASPKPSDRVKVNYHGTLRDGTVFDSTKERGSPAVFRLDRVIKCWTEGVQKMKIGGKSDLYCPAGIAYGDRGAPPKIPGGAALKFEVELVEIVKEDAKAGKPMAKKPTAMPKGAHAGHGDAAKPAKPMAKKPGDAATKTK